MSKKRTGQHPLTLRLSADKIDSNKLINSFKYFEAFLTELAKESLGIEKVKWQISTDKGSNLAHYYEADLSTNERRKLSLVHDKAMDDIQNNKETGILTFKAADSLRKLIKLSQGSNNKPEYEISSIHKGMKHDLLPSYLEYLDRAMGIIEYYGFYEGNLKAISSTRGIKLTLYERINNRAINCSIKNGDQDLVDKALRLFDRRVQAYGQIRKKYDGTPLNIQLTDIQPLPSENQIDPIELKGIFKSYG